MRILLLGVDIFLLLFSLYMMAYSFNESRVGYYPDLSVPWLLAAFTNATVIGWFFNEVEAK